MPVRPSHAVPSPGLQSHESPASRRGVTRRRLPRWHDLPLRINGLAVIGIPVVPLLGIALVFVTMQGVQRRAEAQVTQSHDVKEAVSAALNAPHRPPAIPRARAAGLGQRLDASDSCGRLNPRELVGQFASPAYPPESLLLGVARRVERVKVTAERLAHGQPLLGAVSVDEDEVGRLDRRLRDAAVLLDRSASVGS